jgi:hypothetical protein
MQTKNILHINSTYAGILKKVNYYKRERLKFLVMRRNFIHTQVDVSVICSSLTLNVCLNGVATLYRHAKQTLFCISNAYDMYVATSLITARFKLH